MDGLVKLVDVNCANGWNVLDDGEEVGGVLLLVDGRVVLFAVAVADGAGEDG